jgi:hypothetical protein
MLYGDLFVTRGRKLAQVNSDRLMENAKSKRLEVLVSSKQMCSASNGGEGIEREVAPE